MEDIDKKILEATRTITDLSSNPSLVKTKALISTSLYGNLIAENLLVLGEVLLETSTLLPPDPKFDECIVRSQKLMTGLLEEGYRPDHIVLIAGALVSELGIMALLLKNVDKEKLLDTPTISNNPLRNQRKDLN